MALNVSKLNLEKIQKILNDKYNLFCKDFVKISNGSANLFHIFSNNGDYVLKEFQNNFDVNKVIREIKITKIIKDGGIPTTDFVCTLDNHYYFINEGNIITLQKYIHGITKDYYTLSKSQCIDAAIYCSRIVEILNNSDIELPNFDMSIFESHRINDSIDKCNYLLSNCKDDLMKKVLEHKKEMLINSLDMDFSNIKNVTMMKSHGDYNVSQFIYGADGKIKAILDFASAKSLPIDWELLRSFIFMDSRYDNGEFSVSGLIDYLKIFNKQKLLNKSDIDYMFKIYYMFLLNSMYGFEQFIIDHNAPYYSIGLNLYNQSKYLCENINELTRVLKKKMEVL